jgi:hypothetical protein
MTNPGRSTLDNFKTSDLIIPEGRQAKHECMNGFYMTSKQDSGSKTVKIGKAGSTTFQFDIKKTCKNCNGGLGISHRCTAKMEKGNDGRLYTRVALTVDGGAVGGIGKARNFDFIFSFINTSSFQKITWYCVHDCKLENYPFAIDKIEFDKTGKGDEVFVHSLVIF